MAETDNGTLRAVFSGPNTFLLKVLFMHEGEDVSFSYSGYQKIL